MFEAILVKLRNFVRANKYIVTIHAADEMDEDDLSIYDIERAILNGEIIERQKDDESLESKYLIRGKSLDGYPVIVVTKIGPSNKLIIITVFEDE